MSEKVTKVSKITKDNDEKYNNKTNNNIVCHYELQMNEKP